MGTFCLVTGLTDRGYCFVKVAPIWRYLDTRVGQEMGNTFKGSNLMIAMMTLILMMMTTTGTMASFVGLPEKDRNFVSAQQNANFILLYSLSIHFYYAFWYKKSKNYGRTKSFLTMLLLKFYYFLTLKPLSFENLKQIKKSIWALPIFLLTKHKFVRISFEFLNI